MSRYSRLGWSLLVGGLAFTLGATTASAQGQGNGKAKGHDKQEARARADRDDDHDKDRDHDRRDRDRDRDHDRDRRDRTVVRDPRLRHDDHDRVVVRHEEPRRDPRLHVVPAPAKRRYTSVQAVDVTRDVMHRHGYEVARVERHGDDQVIYYYRGNMGRGRGHGPVERMVIHPDHERLIVRQAPPSAVWSELRAALGL